MTKKIPDPGVMYPIAGTKRLCFLQNILSDPQIVVGEYTYYDDPEDVHNFVKNVLYLFDFNTDCLRIGKFCQISTGARFLMNGGNHLGKGISTFPFQIFGGCWAETPSHWEQKGDIVIGHDVWIGNSATILSGITIGHGSVIGTNALVTRDVAPYSIVGGNPATLIRKRFEEEKIAFLLALAWWDWPVEKITHYLPAIVQGHFDVLSNSSSWNT